MNGHRKVLLVTIAILLGLIIIFNGNVKSENEGQTSQISIVVPPKVAQPPKISTSTPSYLNYEETVRQLRSWENEAEDFVDVINYGESTNGLGLYCVRITNELKKAKYKVLITGAIHGNEPWSSGLMMAYAGNLLDSYGKNERVTEFLDNNEIFVVPIVSPDSYPNSRRVDGVDPNRNFPTRDNPNRKSVPPVEGLKNLFLKHKFDAVLAGHCSGRVFLYPWGDTYEPCPDDALYRKIVGKMGQLSQYRVGKLCNNYSYLIYGVEADWYYRNGAFAFVIEVGSHQRPPSANEIKSEFDRTWEGFLYFLEEAPTALKRVELRQTYLPSA